MPTMLLRYGARNSHTATPLPPHTLTLRSRQKC